MHTFFEQEKRDITPTMQYFIEKCTGNANLSAFEAEAENYVKKLQEPLTPADRYFFSRINQNGIIPPHMHKKILENKELQALEFVKPYIEDYVAEKEEQHCPTQ